MIIPKMNFPFYGLIIVISIFVGMFYIYYNLKKDGYKNKQLFLFFLMYLMFAFIFGKEYTVLAYGEETFFKAGLSAYGGLIGVVIAALVFEKILPADGKIIKYTILSLPLVYGLAKISCFIVGCCGGIPYDGIFKVKYVNNLNIWQFPVQFVEVIVFLIIFLVCQLFNNKKNINFIVLVLSSIAKFLLDFLRYDHVKILVSRNQIFTIILVVIVIVVYFRQKNIKREKNV